MDSYLVCIYSKADNNPRMLVGVIEEVGASDKKAFHNLYKLWDVLNPVKTSARQVRRNKNSKHSQNH